MPEYKPKLSLGSIRAYLKQKKNALMGEVSVVSYVTKPVLESESEGIDPRVVTYVDPKSHIAEQYRSIRTNVASLSPDNPVRSFLITSPLRGEGKTITASNLAVVFSQNIGKKTILIDADLRKPNLHKIFALEKKPGLSEILTDKVDVENFLDKPAKGNLFIIPGGSTPANPAELMGSSKMISLVEKLRERFDWVVFDVAPILAVTDAGVLGNLVDGVIMVVKAGKTQAVDVERAYSLLLEANAKSLASILTGVVTYVPYYLYRYRYIYSRQYYGAY